MGLAAVTMGAYGGEYQDAQIERCLTTLGYYQHEIALVTTTFRDIEDVESYSAVKSISQEGLVYSLIVEARDTARLITWTSVSGFRETAVDKAKVRAVIAGLRDGVVGEPSFRGEGVFGGHSCDFVRVSDDTGTVDGMYSNLTIGTARSGIGLAIHKLHSLVNEGAVISQRASEWNLPPTYDDAEIDEYFSEVSRDLFFELRDSQR